MRHRFSATQWLPYPVPQVFSFLANPQNLPPLMPRWQKARVDDAKIAPPPPSPDRAPRLRGEAAGAGSVITISFRPLPFSPIRLPWKAVISEFAWNDRFCDVMERGPFAYWKHCHSIKPETLGGVPGALITDDVTYEMKMGRLGELAHSVFMRAQVRRIFAYRQRRMAEIFARVGDAAMHLRK